MQKLKTGIQMQVWNLINPLLYKEHGFAMLDFKGIGKDYTHSVIFHNVTESGNISVSEVMGNAQGGKPDKFKKRIAQLNKRDGKLFWWIEDGTGSVILRVN